MKNPALSGDTKNNIVTVGSTVKKKGKLGWVGKVLKLEGDSAEVLWTLEKHPTSIPVSELRLAA